MAEFKQNLTNGPWAVAVVGYRGWRRDSAIGDGITSALSAVLTRCRDRREAEVLAASLNAEQPTILPGTPDVPVYEARRYVQSDYLSRQAREQGGADMRRFIRSIRARPSLRRDLSRYVRFGPERAVLLSPPAGRARVQGVRVGKRWIGRSH